MACLCRSDVVKQRFLQHPNVLKATACRWVVGTGGEALRPIRPEGTQDIWRVPVNEIDEDYLEILEIVKMNHTLNRLSYIS